MQINYLSPVGIQWCAKKENVWWQSFQITAGIVYQQEVTMQITKH